MDSRLMSSFIFAALFLSMVMQIQEAYATQLFLNMTSNTGVGGTNYRILSAASPGVSDTTTSVSTASVTKLFFNPATAGSTATGNPDSDTPVGFGWASDIGSNFTGTMPAGSWSFGTQISGNAGTTGQVTIVAYKTCNLVNKHLFGVTNATDTLTGAALSLTTSFSAPSIILSDTANNSCQIKLEYWLNITAGASAGSATFQAGISVANISFPTPINVINSATLNAPLTDPNILTGGTFAMTGSANTDNSAFGINMTFEYNFTGQPTFVDIPTSAGGLTINTANPQANAQNSTQYSRTITGNTPGVYFVRIRVYNSTNSVTSSIQKITVNSFPNWSNQGQNASLVSPGRAVLLSTLWNDQLTLSTGILETNETGVAQNKSGFYGSPATLSGTSSWTNFTWQNTSVPGGTVVQWRIFANNTLNNFNVTPYMTFKVVQQLSQNVSQSITLNTPTNKASLFERVGSLLLSFVTPSSKASLFNRVNSLMLALFPSNKQLVSPVPPRVIITAGGEVAPAALIAPIPAIAIEFTKVPVLEEVLPGQTTSDNIIVRNIADRPVSGINVGVTGQMSSSITITPAVVDLSPNESKTLSIAITVPSGTAQGDYLVTIVAKSTDIEDRTSFIMRVGSFVPESEVVRTERHVSVDSNAKSAFVTLIMRNGYSQIPRVDVTENIKKSIARTIDSIEFLDAPDKIVQRDPVVVWTITNFQPNATRIFSYIVRNASIDSSPYLYWPVEELSVAYAEAPSGLTITPIRALELIADTNVSAPITIGNIGGAKKTVSISMILPDNWTAYPAAINYTLFPGETQTFRFLVTPPATTLPGYYSGKVRISADNALVIKGYQFVVVSGEALPTLVPILAALVISVILAYLFYSKKSINIFRWMKRQ